MAAICHVAWEMVSSAVGHHHSLQTSFEAVVGVIAAHVASDGMWEKVGLLA